MKIFLLICFLNIYFFSSAQNLVNNPGFEDTISCPNGFGFVDKATYWISYNANPDYFNTCSPSCYNSTCFGIPQNMYGSQAAHSGNAYVGLGTYAEFPFQNYREIIGSQLTQPLIPGTKYFVSCFVSRAGGYSFSPLGKGASNNFGFRFYINPYSGSNPCPIDNYSQLHETALISDSINWTRITGSFIADSAFEYIALGNFYLDELTDTLEIEDHDTTLFNFAYYYVDDICVSTDSLFCNSTSGTQEANENKYLRIFPNPFSKYFYLQYSNENFNKGSCLIYNLLGEKVYETNLKCNQQEIDLGELSGGVYFCTILIDDDRFTYKLIKQ
jgi:hypothetical protein